MKISINVFDVGEFELHVEPQSDGNYTITKAFYAFLKRPGRPHLSLFMEAKPGRAHLEPHFTAHRQSPRQFREVLAQVRPEVLQAGLEACASVAAEQFVDRIQRVDLDILEAEGWTVHFLDGRAVRRWLRRGPPWRIDVRTLTSFTKHLFRHARRPSALKTLAPAVRGEFAALHLDRAGRLRARMLMRYTNDVPVSVFKKGSRQTLPAGWYMLDARQGETPISRDVVSTERLEAIGEAIQRLLARYPLRPDSPELDTSLDEWPQELVALFGMYASDLLHCIIDLKAERQRSSSAA